MSQSPEEIKNDTGKQIKESKATASPENYQQLFVAYKCVRQERDMLRQALQAFRLSKVRHQSALPNHRG